MKRPVNRICRFILNLVIGRCNKASNEPFRCLAPRLCIDFLGLPISWPGACLRDESEETSVYRAPADPRVKEPVESLRACVGDRMIAPLEVLRASWGQGHYFLARVSFGCMDDALEEFTFGCVDFLWRRCCHADPSSFSSPRRRLHCAGNCLPAQYPPSLSCPVTSA